MLKKISLGLILATGLFAQFPPPLCPPHCPCDPMPCKPMAKDVKGGKKNTKVCTTKPVVTPPVKK